MRKRYVCARVWGAEALEQGRGMYPQLSDTRQVYSAKCTHHIAGPNCQHPRRQCHTPCTSQGGIARRSFLPIGCRQIRRSPFDTCLVGRLSMPGTWVDWCCPPPPSHCCQVPRHHCVSSCTSVLLCLCRIRGHTDYTSLRPNFRSLAGTRPTRSRPRTVCSCPNLPTEGRIHPAISVVHKNVVSQ